MSVRDLPVLKSELLQILSELSRDKFFVEFNGYFSCHLLQATVALYHLGASREKFSAFVENYVMQLEGADGKTRRLQDDCETDALLTNDEDDDFELNNKTMMETTVEELKGIHLNMFGNISKYNSV
jgi:hypothetical protein